MSYPQQQNRSQNNQQIARVDQIKPLLLAAQRQITSLLQDEVKAKKFMAASLVVASNPALNKCSPDSIVQALIGVAMSDLNIDTNIGHCYLVPYGDKVQLQIGYKGFIQLLFRAGWMVKPFPVYQCDTFSMDFDGWNNRVEFIPNIDERDEGDKDWVYHNLRGVYVVARHADTKDEYSAFVNKTVIEKLRLNSPNQRASQWTKPEDKKRLDAGLPIGVWADWYVEMAQSKAIKKLAKILPIGDNRANAAISADDKNEMGKTVDYAATADNGVVIEMTPSETTYGDQGEPSAKTLNDVLASISAASTREELDAIVFDINQLEAAGQRQARSAWTKQSSVIAKAESQSNAKSENSEPTQAKAPVDTDWKAKIKECKTQAHMDALLKEMPEAVQMELQDAIDLHYDVLR
jgi:recombination protein RecT